MGHRANERVTIRERASRMATKLTGCPIHKIDPERIDYAEAELLATVEQDRREREAVIVTLRGGEVQSIDPAPAGIEAVRDAFYAGRRRLLDERAAIGAAVEDDGEVAFQHYLRTIRPSLV